MGNESPETLRRLALKCRELEPFVGHTLGAELRVWAEQADCRAEGLEDAELVSRTAAELVALMGRDVIAYLRSRAEIAAGIADRVSEQAWLDIAEAAGNLLRDAELAAD
jgi:hypothetical protein